MNSIPTILIVFATGFCLIDVCLVLSYGGQAADEIGWGWIAAGLCVQFAAAFVGAIGIVSKIGLLRRGLDKEPVASYRRYIPVTTLGVALAGLALSIDLLHIGIVCPEGSLPVGRGQPACPLPGK